MSISTHKMLANAGIENTAQIVDQASTLSANTRTFFDCSDSAGGGETVDVIKGSKLVDDGATNKLIVQDGAVSGVTVQLMANPPQSITVADYDDPDTQDYIIIACGRSVDLGLDVDDNGGIAFYYGDSDNGQMKVQPYYAVFSDSTTPIPLTRSIVTTPFQEGYKFRDVGDDYMFSALKRGDYMEHYADGNMTGSVNVAAHHDGYLSAKWRNQTGKGRVIRLGHSAYGDQKICDDIFLDAGVCEVLGEIVPSFFTIAPPNTVNSIVDKEQDYYGILVHFFPNGAPSQSEIEAGMTWMKERWLNGDKVIYPGWMF